MYFLNSKIVRKLLTNTLPSFQLTDKNNLNLGFGGIYYAITRAIRPQNVVVIGSKGGFAPIMFALALKHNEGHGIEKIQCENVLLRDTENLPVLHFIDPSYSLGRDQNHWYGLGKWDDPKKVRKLWKSFGVEKIISHYKMISADYLRDATSLHLIDILFVDGDHSYEGITHDFTAFFDRLKVDGLVLAHDVDPRFKYESSELEWSDLVWSDSNLDNSKTGGYEAFLNIPDSMYERIRLPVYPGLAIMRKKRGNI